MSKLINTWIAVFLLILTVACHKEIDSKTVSDQLTGKVWYLEKLIIASNTYVYRGASTFSFSLDRGTSIYWDSDGILGTYLIYETQDGALVLVNSTNRVIQPLRVTQLEKDHFVAEIVKNNELQILYFSVRP